LGSISDKYLTTQHSAQFINDTKQQIETSLFLHLAD